ncbi:hypothetical protein [Leptospira andrefontaineae]|uniref:Uncharacterized protein n=1 Tax=Leptospira andrefontaineae TaxID=2484976 RepID=A0A4R9GY17_9LEPT|nr:hypothetical protein [Leptospira andrefontaineae]TGK36228.1 hypothetical protein EHO65_18150 [Leptospira andrefontaineae]
MGTYHALGIIPKGDPFDIYSGPAAFDDLENSDIILDRRRERSITIDKDAYIEQYLEDHAMVEKECSYFDRHAIHRSLARYSESIKLEDFGEYEDRSPKVASKSVRSQVEEIKKEIRAEMLEELDRILKKFLG